MGTYVTFTAKNAELVNAKFQLEYYKKLENHTFVVYSKSVIIQEVAYIHVDPNQEYLAEQLPLVDDMDTVISAWEDILPAFKLNTGSIKVSYEPCHDQLCVLEFVNNNQDLFSEIHDESGLYINKQAA